jgi:hypothetical protein
LGTPRKASPQELEELLKYATPPQARYIKAYIEHGSQHKAATALGVNQSQVSQTIARVMSNAARMGYAPAHDMTHAVPDGFHVRGVSTYYDGEGNPKAQWVKSAIDQDELEQRIRDAFDALRDGIPKAKLVPPTKAKRSADLLNLHILTDFHLGAKAWHEESGEDWDLSIAEDLLVRWFTVAIENAPSASIGVLGQLGDFLHWDGYDAVTPASKHLLDADTRFQKLVRVAIRATRRIVALMLQKYDRVHLIMADANHDPASGAWLREMFAAFYDTEPRITVDNSADTYYCLEHGTTSLFFHHGHKRKPAAVDDVFVAKFREVFGRTKFSFAHMGHMHHDMKLETNLMTVEQHRTMAAKDAYASRGGWMAGRGAPVITYHKRYGEVGRQVYTPEMV